jgi:hypothetical protein
LLAFTTLFAGFYLFVYLTLYSFGHLLQERDGIARKSDLPSAAASENESLTPHLLD